MRNDMAKVIVERPRTRGDGNIGNRRQRRRRNRSDPETMSLTESMRKHHKAHYGGKELNENLQPLRRWLRSQVGRPWSKVYADAKTNLDVRTAVQKHVFDHLKQYVCVDTIEINRVVFCFEGGTARRADTGYYFRGDSYYVHPRTGLLCRPKANPKRRWYLRGTKDIWFYDEHHAYGRRGREWFVLTFKDAPRKAGQTVVEDAWLRRPLTFGADVAFSGNPAVGYSREASDAYHNGYLYCVDRKRLPAAEAHAMGLP